jgi:hypothetical protein
MDIKTHSSEGERGKPDQIGERVALVDDLVKIGVTVTRACTQIGIPRVTYYYRKRSTQKETPGSSHHGGSQASSLSAISSTHLSHSDVTRTAGDAAPSR